MNELNRLANELEAEQLTDEDIDNIIQMVRQRLSGYDAGARVKSAAAESANIWDVVKVPEPTIKLKRRI
jgi:hypothetical protein